MAALAKQGTICSENEGHGRVCAKLRFRFQKRQIVRYIGTKRDFVEKARTELSQLQAKARNGRRMRRRDREGRQAVRNIIKPRLAPLLADLGYRIRGLSIRKMRRSVEGPSPD
jgi:hypothetical protein